MLAVAEPNMDCQNSKGTGKKQSKYYASIKILEISVLSSANSSEIFGNSTAAIGHEK